MDRDEEQEVEPEEGAGQPAHDVETHARREAQDFLFNSDKDFEMVCTAAGLNWQNFRLKLTKIGRKVEMEGTLRFPLAA